MSVTVLGLEDTNINNTGSVSSGEFNLLKNLNTDKEMASSSSSSSY